MARLPLSGPSTDSGSFAVTAHVAFIVNLFRLTLYVGGAVSVVCMPLTCYFLTLDLLVDFLQDIYQPL